MEDKKDVYPFAQLSMPAQRALANAGITTLEQLSAFTSTEVMKLHGIGKNAFQKLQDMMNDKNISFRN